MKQPVTSKGLRIIAIITILGVATVLLIQRFGPYPRQMQNMAAAGQHIQILRPMLQQDSRFTNIALHAFTGVGGSLSLSGELYSDRDLAHLKQLVQASKPPVEVVYHVFVVPPELLEDWKKSKSETPN
ncbi:MAG: hypothetical protein HZA90_06625 [Verrucomicrobia bacterium]|nr:hypothetical protein [Verrucomicrobiota bacterium]